MTFNDRITRIEKYHAALISCPTVTRDDLPQEIGSPGVYLFCDDITNYYVGRSRNVRERIMQHTRASVLDAPFAFKRAREITGFQPTYQIEGSRSQLLADDAFVNEILEQKRWIAELSVRYVLVEDAVDQALLEIYSSDVLSTPYNDFNTT